MSYSSCALHCSSSLTTIGLYYDATPLRKSEAIRVRASPWPSWREKTLTTGPAFFLLLRLDLPVFENDGLAVRAVRGGRQLKVLIDELAARPDTARF